MNKLNYQNYTETIDRFYIDFEQWVKLKTGYQTIDCKTALKYWPVFAEEINKAIRRIQKNG